jgi:hypothetical protein
MHDDAVTIPPLPSRLLQAVKLPPQGIPRLERVEDKPWCMRECALLDADGNLLKLGRVRCRTC